MTSVLLVPTLLPGHKPLATTAAPCRRTTVQITGLVLLEHIRFWCIFSSPLVHRRHRHYQERNSYSKRFDECSPPLFALVLLGTTITSLTLTERSPQAIALMLIKLGKAHAASYQLNGDQSTPSPIEQISFDYENITFENPGNGVKFCYDKALRVKC
jgi:hypothetical protein